MIPLVADSRSAKDAAQNASSAAARVPIAVASILTITLVVALDEAVAESLRGGVLEVAGPLRVIALPTLRIARARVYTVLVALIQRSLVAVVVAPVVAITTITTVTIIAAVMSPIPIPLITPVSIMVTTVSIMVTTILTITGRILRLSCSAGRSRNAKNNSHCQDGPTDAFSQILHVCYPFLFWRTTLLNPGEDGNSYAI